MSLPSLAISEKELIEKARSTSSMRSTFLTSPPSKKQVADCVNGWRPKLRDPDSAKAVTSKIRLKANGEKNPPVVFREVIIEGRAANGFGGMAEQYFVCGLKADGTVDLSSVELYQLMLRLDHGPKDFLDATD